MSAPGTVSIGPPGIHYRTRVLVIYIMALAMTVIDTTMVNVALPRLAEEFGVASTDIEWIAVGYLLSYAAVIPPSGWLGDRFGTRRLFVVALVVFVAMSVACGFAQSLGQLVLLRILQGVGGGLLTPVGSAMLYRAYPLAERAKAAIAVLSVVVVAPAMGPLVGGLLVDHASWRWIFLINGPIGAVALVLSLRWLMEERHDHPGRFDIAGFALSTLSVASLLYGLSSAPENGWSSPTTVALFVVGVCSGIAVVVIELRIPEPMLALRLFHERVFRTINVAAITVYAGFFGMIFVLPLYMQTLRGYSAFQSGLAQAPQAAGIFIIANLFGARLYRSVGPRRLMVVGSALTAAVTCAYALAGLDTPIGAICLLSLARGLSVGLVFVSLQTAVYTNITPADTGRATSLFNTQRQISYAAGVALAATVIASRLDAVGGDAAPTAERLQAYQWGFVVCGLVMLPAIVASWYIRDEDVAATRGLA